MLKKSDGNKVENFRKVTLAETLYKVYAEILAKRLKEEVEKRADSGKSGFRKGRETMDNVCVVNYLVNKNVSRKGGELVALFVDLRTAFDSVDRRKLMKTIREKRVREGLVRE